MKIQDLQKISEYFDEEAIEPQEIIELLDSDPDCKKLYGNFQIISAFIKKDSQQFINSQEIEIDNFWPKLENRLSDEEKNLNELLASAFVLPPALEEIDLWNSLENKINSLPEEQMPAQDNSPTYSFKAQNWEVLLHESFQLPTELEENDIWPQISQKLDSIYHTALFSENLPESLSSKERFFLGLSEYFDGEVSAAKAKIINDHLIECSGCRGYYLNLVKLKNVLKQSFVLPENLGLSEDEFWLNFENNLFPQNTPQKKLV